MTMSFDGPQRLPEALDDQTLAEQRPMVRGQLVSFLEGLWQYSSEELESGKDHVRWAELQLRIVKQLAELYKLNAPTAEAAKEVEPGEEREAARRMVSMQLDDLEQRDAG